MFIVPFWPLWNTGWKSCLRVMLLIKNLPQEDEITCGR